jgi:DNA mismatch endonuclease, patch repair protein
MPATNSAYWVGKIERNKNRDIQTTTLLTESGWTVLRYWAHDEPLMVAASIRRTVNPEGP